MALFEGGAALPITTGGQGPVEACAAVPVYVVPGGPVIGQRARRVVVVTSGPVEGGAAIPVYDAGANALYSGEAALPVFVVVGGGSLSGGGSVAATYLINDQFTTNSAAPLTSPRTAEPGPGVGTIVDTENKFTIAGSVLVVAGGKTVNAWGDPGINWLQTIFPVNRVFDGSVRQRSTLTYGSRFGFRDGASAFCNASFLNTGQAVIAFAGLALSTVQSTWYQCRIASGAERYYLFIKGGIYTSWQLAFVAKKAESPNLFPAFTNLDFIGDIDDIALYDSSGWGELGAYTGYSATGAAITGSANGFVELTWTPQAAETLDLQFRRTDDNNTLIARGNQAGSTIQLFSKTAGVETQIGTDQAQTWTANTTYTILVYLNGTTVRVWTAQPTGNTNSYTSKFNTTSAVQQSATGAKSSGGAWVKDLLSWPLTYADTFLTQTALRTPLNILPYGDSKTADGTGFLTDSYVQYLCRAIGAAETPTRIAVGGQTTAGARAVIDARLASAVGTPNLILYNLGANDVILAMVQATWEADTAYILDAMHTKWPAAHIYLMRVWRRGELTDCNTLATWQDNVLATRSAWAHVGPDERIFLEAGDDGVRYTADGTHPRIQEGYVLTAQAWKAALGL